MAMKLMKIASLVALALIMSAGTVMADDSVTRDQTTVDKMLHKMGRGVVNVVTCWVEVPRQISKQWEQTDPVTGLFVGGAKGIGWGFARLMTGVYETCTFPFPVPAGYGPMIEPEFVVTDTWGAGVPELTDMESNDPHHPANAPVYPQNFNF
jgi:putative exosortase-associated protein (TIGR04073 family)